MSESADVPPLTKANNHLAVELLKLLSAEETNVFFSPFSLSTAMGMLYLGTIKQTAEELRHALGYSIANLEDNELASSYKRLLNDLEKTPKNYVLCCANSVLSQKKFKVKTAFKKKVAETFKALMLEVDFLNESEKVLKQINGWVGEKTQNMIPQLLEKLGSDTVMVLLNAVYFKGNWLRQFDVKKTKKELFYNNGIKNQAKKINMMHLSENFLYMEDESFKALQLPYKGEEVAMMILLPHRLDGVKELGNQLSSSFIHDTKKIMWQRKVSVSLPKFRMEYSKSFDGCFHQMGVNKIFNIGADFDGMSDSKLLCVSEIVHKAVLDVNEEGCEAAAATAVIMVLRSAPPRDISFVADHPFLFVIYDTRTDLILFVGKVEEL